MQLKQLRNSLLLLLTATIWGFAFVAQSAGMDYVGPFTFTFTRSIIACIFLLPYFFFCNKFGNKEKNEKEDRKLLWLGGILCGLALAIASCFQQIGIQYTTVGKAGFITAFYIIIVPLLGILFGNKNNPFVWISVLIALSGLYFLCISGHVSIERGDLLVFICAFCFSGQILIIDHFNTRVDPVKMSCIQFLVVSLFCLLPMLILEKPNMSQITDAWVPILYAGILSSGVGYTLQIIGQKDMNPTVASLIMSLESVVSVIAGMLILNERMTSRELLGCCLMFTAIVLAQLPYDQIKEKLFKSAKQKA